jgi:hypothetical protein
MITDMKLLAAIAVLCASFAPVSCNRPAGDSDVIELQRVRSGDLDVVLLSKDGTFSSDQDTLTIEFRRGESLVDVGTVKAAATMPMAGLPEMRGSIFIERGDTPGRYTAETDLSMSGGWNLKIEWDGATGRGSASFHATVE